VNPPQKGLSLKVERIVEYKESLIGVEDGCSGNSLIMQFRCSRADEKYMECRVRMLECLLKTYTHRSAFYGVYPHPARETVYEFSFSHNFP